MGKTMNASIGPFQEAVHFHKKRWAALAAEGHNLLGYFCTYTPVEILHAAGFIPLRLMGESTTISRADALTPNFICPYLRKTLEDGLKGEYEFLSGVVQGYTCDAVCGMINIWEENIGAKIVHSLPLPYNDAPDARVFFRSVVLEFIEKLNRAGGMFSETALERSLGLYAEIRQAILELYRCRYDGLMPLDAAEFLTVMLAGFVMAPEDYLKALNKLVSQVKNSGLSDRKGVPVLVSGSLVESPGILEILEASGGRVVADDLCTGYRHIHPASGEGRNPLDRLVDRYMRRFPCPARSRAVDRAQLMMELIRRSGAKAVVFLLQKFCTPHLADIPILTGVLKNEGIPAIMVEMEESGLMEGQLRTRLEGFFEMIGDAA
jgi:benzoyl-CoA reductase/2-hydroxyglutaryl-CoA dehydratase subunit BcrC/BadD/HgdB